MAPDTPSALAPKKFPGLLVGRGNKTTGNSGKKTNKRKRRPGLSRFHRQLLGEFPYLPPTALIPLPVAAVIEGCSTKRIRRNYQLEQISEWRQGVRKMYLRGAGEAIAT